MSDSSTSTSTGFGRVLVAIYAVFAVAATSRSVYQLATRYDEAPVAYVLSAIAGIIYVVATLALARDWPRIASTAIGVELVGVITVGLLTVLDSTLFPDETVWSGFGQGYVYIPLILPFAGLWWIRRATQVAKGSRSKE